MEATSIVTNFVPYSKWDELVKKLLSMGGSRVVDQHDPFAPLIHWYGQLTPTDKVDLKVMQPNLCHWNCKKLAKRSKNYAHFYGYGLSEDGLWRAHSWVYDFKHRRILETTEKRLKYFGVIIGDLLDGI